MGALKDNFLHLFLDCAWQSLVLDFTTTHQIQRLKQLFLSSILVDKVQASSKTSSQVLCAWELHFIFLDVVKWLREEKFNF